MRSLSGRQVALGVFILAQLFFLFTRNGFDVLEDVRKHLQEKVRERSEPHEWSGPERLAPGWIDSNSHINYLFESVDRSTKAYAQATEQLQSWSLFPSVGRECVFPALRIYWKDENQDAKAKVGKGLKNPLALMAAADPFQALGTSALLGADPEALKSPTLQLVSIETARLAASNPLESAVFHAAATPDQPHAMPPAAELYLSDNEPRDITRYFRVGNFRLRRYECSIVVTLAELERPETEDERKERWARYIRDHLNEYGEFLHVYMRWRLAQIMKETGTTELPSQVVLVERRFKVAVPKKAPPYMTGPFEVPIARWRLGRPPDPGFLALELYDPVSETFQQRRK